MSAPRQEDPNDSNVKRYLTGRLQRAQQQGRSFDSTDEFIDYLHSNGGLDKICEEWIDNAPNRVLRELLKDHNSRGKDQTSAAQAPSLNVVGSYVPASDSGYGPGSPMDDQPMQSPSQDPTFNVICVPIAAPDDRPHSLLARIDTARDKNTIDLECARTLCGNQVTLGGRAEVRYRFDEDDPDGTKIYQMTCVVGNEKDENIVFSRKPPGFPYSDVHSGYPVGNSAPQKSSVGQDEFDKDDPEYKDRRTKLAARMAVEMAGAIAKEEMQNKKRPPEDDGDRHHPARRMRR